MKASYFTASVTLFNEDGTLDLKSQGILFDRMIEKGIDGILVGGSSSEFHAMDMETRRELAEFSIKKVNHRVKLIIGTSNMIKDDIITLSNEVLDAGADAVMILPPYYFHFEENEVFDYYDSLASQIHGNIYLYNYPGNVGYEITPQTVLRLVKKHSNIIGLKDTVPGVEHTREVIKLVKSFRPEFEVYSGFDDNLARNIISGGNGVISALANVIPEVISGWLGTIRNNDLEGVSRYQKIIDKMMELYSTTQPFMPSFKRALKLRGIAECDKSIFPTQCASDKDEEKIRELLKSIGIE